MITLSCIQYTLINNESVGKGNFTGELVCKCPVYKNGDHFLMRGQTSLCENRFSVVNLIKYIPPAFCQATLISGITIVNSNLRKTCLSVEKNKYL